MQIKLQPKLQILKDKKKKKKVWTKINTLPTCSMCTYYYVYLHVSLYLL